jgi:hypothetical protein
MNGVSLELQDDASREGWKDSSLSNSNFRAETRDQLGIRQTIWSREPKGEDWGGQTETQGRKIFQVGSYGTSLAGMSNRKNRCPKYEDAVELGRLGRR